MDESSYSMSKQNTINDKKEITIFKKKKKVKFITTHKKFLFIMILFFIAIIIINRIYLKLFKNNYTNNINFLYENYENNIITEKMKNYANWKTTLEQINFINGIIRKKKLKNCLEIGVAYGGTSIVILNAIKDMKNSFLVSLDLNEQVYMDPKEKTGSRVNKYFPELTKNWKLYTGDQPHKFLVKLNLTFDFLFLDTAHITPGEVLNFIECLPFLKEKAVVVIHDIIWHFYDSSSIKFHPAPILLIPSLYGDKVILGYSKGEIKNIGAIFLYPHQERHYLDYFLLLLNFWEYMPNENQINDLRIFIKKYFKKDIYLKIFNMAVSKNENYIKRFQNLNNNSNNYKNIILNLGSKKTN